jgi:hypothetical protein
MGFMSFLRYLCALAHSGVQHILCCVFLFLFVLCFVYPMLPVSLDYPFFLLLFSIPWRLLDCAVNFPSLTNWFHFTIWETRIAETSRILYIYSPDAKSNKCVNPSPVYLRALHVPFGHSKLWFCDKNVFQSTVFLRFTQLKKPICVWITLRCCELRYSRK